MKQTILNLQVLAEVTNESEAESRVVSVWVRTEDLQWSVVELLLERALPEFAEGSSTSEYAPGIGG